MGSPDSENWRIDDETQHKVNVSAFYIDPYETLQTDYEALMGSDPSTFDGEGLPVDNISWLDAVQYANARSNAAGLNPAYTISVRTVNHQSTYCQNSRAFKVDCAAYLKSC